jgi:hypothetical protein
MHKLTLTMILLAFGAVGGWYYFQCRPVALVELRQPAPRNYTFYVAGHAYGSHHGRNVALHEPFLRRIRKHEGTSPDFIVFTGDFLRVCRKRPWRELEEQLAQLNVPVFLVRGNHEASKFCGGRINARHGGTFYRFDYGDTRFVVLDSQLESRAISSDQVRFLREAVEEAHSIDTFFVFFHEVLWLNHARYRGVKANSRSRYRNISASNYWDTVHPIFESFPKKRFIVVSGDVGGNPDSIPAFYEQHRNVTLLASGMGEIQDENYLEVTMMEGDPSFRLVPLARDHTLLEIEDYVVEKLVAANAP